MRYEKLKVPGAWLEGFGIREGAVLTVDLHAEPRTFDLVWCSGIFGGELGGYIAELIQKGDRPMVRECCRDKIYHPAEIYGVVVKAEREGEGVVWQRPSGMIRLLRGLSGRAR